MEGIYFPRSTSTGSATFVPAAIAEPEDLTVRNTLIPSHTAHETGKHCYAYSTAGDLKHRLIGNMSKLIFEVSRTPGS